jgi:alkylhydroperoxidase/carboxymuconolactone decarboxylase family protein YurZ
VEPIVYPLSKQATVVGNSQRLKEVSPALADAFWVLRNAANAHATLSARERELVFVAAFAGSFNEGGFRVHINHAHKAGVSVQELEQVVLLMLGTSLGLAPTVQLLAWLHEELD